MPKKKKSTKKEPKVKSEVPKIEKTKLFQNFVKIVKQFMAGRGYTPLPIEDLMERLYLPPQHLPIITHVLQRLVKDRVLVEKNNRYSLKENNVDIVTGVINMHPRGFGFVRPDDPSVYAEDIFIPKHVTQNAVDGDKVEVVVSPESFSEKGPEGKVVAILSRGRTHIAGIIRTVEKFGDTVAYVPILGVQQRVVVENTSVKPLQVGDRVVMEVIDWGSKESETLCRVSHYLGHISDPGCDIKAAIEEYELRSDFPTPVVEEAKSFGKAVAQKDIKGRKNLRTTECFTIDPDTAKDFDDAVSLKKDKKGHYHLGVHIADVSHYVKKDSALDKEAKERCNSTYFPSFCLPMLPPELSENLCSLKADVNRLTISVLMEFDPHGTLLNYSIEKSVIKSAKRFTYREAKEVLDGKKESEHLPTLELMVELCGHLKRSALSAAASNLRCPILLLLSTRKVCLAKQITFLMTSPTRWWKNSC